MRIVHDCEARTLRQDIYRMRRTSAFTVSPIGKPAVWSFREGRTEGSRLSLGESLAAFAGIATDSMDSNTTPAPSRSGQTGWEWKTHTERWVESAGKPSFRVVPDDTKPTLRDPLSTSDPTETEHFILRPPPFTK